MGMPGQGGRNWMANAFGKHPGALHHQLGYGVHETIPPGILHEIDEANRGTHVRGHTVTPLLQSRTRLALRGRGE